MKGWKTITIAILIALTGFFQELTDGGIIPENVTGYILMGIGFIVGILRMITTSAVFKKE